MTTSVFKRVDYTLDQLLAVTQTFAFGPEQLVLAGRDRRSSR